MCAAGCQYGAVGFKMSVPHYDDAITELAMKSLVVQLLEYLGVYSSPLGNVELMWGRYSIIHTLVLGRVKGSL